MKNNNKQ